MVTMTNNLNTEFSAEQLNFYIKKYTLNTIITDTTNHRQGHEKYIYF